MQFTKNLLLAFLCACSFFTYAQNLSTLKGYLKNNADEPLAGVTVTLQNTTSGTISDDSGFFMLRNLKPGHYTLVLRAIGYKTQVKQVSLNQTNNATLKITLDDNTVDMQTVTVTGRSAVQESNRQAFNVTAVDAKKLYNTTLNLADALDRVSGVRVRESGGVGSDFNLSLNGLSGNHVRFFIDGIPMENFGSSFQINNIPINIAERVEVYKGVVPVWLGSDALGGAINIITGDRYRNYIDASYSYGSFNTHRSVINAAVTSKKGYTLQLNAFQNYSDNDYKVKVDVSDAYTGAYTPNAIVRRFHDQYHNETLIANIGVVDKRFADKLLFGITLGKNYKEIQTGARMVSVFGAWHRRGDIVMPTFKYKKVNLIKGLDLTLNANYNLGTEQNIDTVNGRYDWYGTLKPTGSNGERSRSLYKYKNHNGIATAMANYRLSDNQSIAVSDVFNTFNRKGSDVLNPTVTANELPKKTQKNVLGIGYTYDIKDKWSASIFGKQLYQHNVTGNAQGQASTNKFGYGVAATYFVIPNLQIKSSYELTNRLPEAQEIFGDVENQEGNPNLKPEQSKNVNLGLNYNFAINSDNRFLVNANAFYRHASNFIFYRLNNNQTKLVADNRDGVSTIGGDGEIRYSYRSWLSVGTTLTYQYLQNLQKYEPGYTSVSLLYKDQMPNIPFLFGNSDASVSLKNVGRSGNNLNISYNLLYVHAFWLYWPSYGGRNETEKKYGIPQQISHDVSLVYTMAGGKYNVGLECRNLFNAYLYDNFSLQKPGRAFYLNLRYFFNKTHK
ncbi:TonB-dependent receptor [Mucilaginibacter robiniae]|uniref:TonB-dependent receptor n=1 Tax=Mucilaginibacter robiniae TaxID=2728022 RepID=A0A7L5DZJ6_9SPHI|nr:TonB-dependent receptor [Mucilaginibacter robiniae]QJD95449.1 TonB-dependent receptor [Mucilaginibacter robiniae]